MSYLNQQEPPELLDELCQALAHQDVPELKSVPMMPWEQTQTLRTQLPKGLASWCGRGLTVSLATIVVLACGFLISGLFNGNAVFAQVQEAASKIRSVRFRIFEYDGDRDPKVTSIVISSGEGERSDSSDGVEVISNFKNGKRLSLDHRSKTAAVVQTFGSSASLDQLWDKVIKAPAESVKQLESGTIDGKKVNRFEVRDVQAMIISVDPTSNLPVRMEMEVENNADGAKRQRYVATGFIFNSAVDPSLLSTIPPSGYQVTESSRPSGRRQYYESDLVVSPQTGIGGLALGSSKEAVIAKLGQPDSIQETKVAGVEVTNLDNTKTKLPDSTTVELQYPSDGFSLTIGSNGLRSVSCFGTKLRGNLAQDFVGKTENGIKLGATIADVIAKFGPPGTQSSGQHGRLQYPHKGHDFLFIEGKLASFSIYPPLPNSVKVTDHGNGKVEYRSTDE